MLATTADEDNETIDNLSMSLGARCELFIGCSRGHTLLSSPLGPHFLLNKGNFVTQALPLAFAAFAQIRRPRVVRPSVMELGFDVTNRRILGREDVLHAFLIRART